jgi:ADP-heptose:LPS heptosyltransferase
MNVVVTRLQNIGDMLVFTPALRLLRKSLPPEARITLLAKHAQGIEMVRRCPYIDNIIAINGRGLLEKFRIIREFRRLKPELFIVSPQDQGKVPWAVLGGAKKIAAFKSVIQRGEIKREKLTFMIDVAPDFDAAKSETENSVNLVAKALERIGVKAHDNDLKLEYSWFQPDTPERVSTVLKAAGVDMAKPFAVIAPFSKAEHKNWPLERFDALQRHLREAHGLQVLLTGGEKDKDGCAKLTGCVNLAGSLSLDQSAWLLKGAKLYVGNDSGPSHLASAVGTPTLVFYRKESHCRWRLPDSSAKRVELVAEQNDICEISVERALSAIEELLR